MRPPILKRLLRRLASAAALGLLAATLSATTAQPAAAAAGLQQVTGFGSNPGNLQMYAYTPAGLPANAPLVVALHGCAQSADAYYTNSGWPRYADAWGFAVVFPQTTSANNALSCFNWFDPAEDTRGRGEAASVVQMVDYAKEHYGSDDGRVYVTGLSAGGGMAADLLAAYPDVFAGGSIASGIPAQCATSQTAASACQYAPPSLTPAQWGDKVRAAHPGYDGPWPRVAIWHGTSDYTVRPANATALRDQWTDVWGIGQTPSATDSLPGNTTRTVYEDASGQSAVELYTISGMGHGLPVDPGSGDGQCGSTAAYFLDTICSTYHTGVFWGLDDGTAPGGGTDPGDGDGDGDGGDPGTPVPARCHTATNYAHVTAGRAHMSGGYVYANGSEQNMGLYNVFVSHTLRESPTGYYVIADNGCTA
ncbi:PHB depolymerase family esterase [Streptomyces sp. OfavH-34-F]|uniref:extracellular catalytic domain type 1 short-chain-length polyhydroxyalkanoate depolymerase n=1 Tax=Streptomyces sp. OfavH-34-F TaxID=2917760 RepID=UPI001EF1A9B5|nr:PHB depolymerase family esterase [Streptomyces sp. OfavH-34-F]MCG7525654.1 PHB depolymerase family esterase [Streptomyces sp. OfavH-34-F]